MPTLSKMQKSALDKRLKLAKAELSEDEMVKLTEAMDSLAGVAGVLDMLLTPPQEAAEDEAKPEEKAEQFKSADLPEPARIAFEKMAEQNAETRLRLEKAELKLFAREKAAATRQWVEKAKTDAPNIPGTAEDAGSMLAQVADVNPDLAVTLFEMFKSASAAVEAAPKFVEQGSSRQPNAGGGSVMAKVQEKARSLREKSGSEMTFEQAEARVWEDYPELYAEYEAECNARNSRN